VPDELLELAADREPVVVLTAPWHERDTQSLVERLGVPVFVPPLDTADDLVRKYGIAPERAGSPDVAWLLAGDGGEAHLVLWIESRRAVVAGDALVDFGRGFEIPQESLTKGVTREQVVEGLRPLLALPVEVVLPAHGAPTDRAALERALS
jgi:glyoxylase-like metal-dependent hydrolase (beta-lactamase superfamily II)